MKKLFFIIVLAFVFLLTSCDFSLGDITGPTDNGNSNGSITDSTKFQMKSEESIKSNIGSFTLYYTIHNYDGTFNLKVYFDGDTNYGVVEENEVERYFYFDSHYNTIYYSESDYGCDYRVDYTSHVFYLKLLYDISNEIVSSTIPYESKTSITYAQRNCTKYVIADRYTIADQQKLNIVVDNETGAVLSITYDDLDWFTSTKFVPKDSAAKQKVASTKENVKFDYIDQTKLSLVGQNNISFPDWSYLTASYYENDGVFAGYSFQFSTVLESVNPIKEIAKVIYDNGLNHDSDGNSKTFDELWDYHRGDVGVKAFDFYMLYGSITSNGKKYIVCFEGRNDLSTANEWIVSFYIEAVNE